MSEQHETPTTFILPTSIVSKIDFSRLITEIEQYDNDVSAKDVRIRVGMTQLNELSASPRFQAFLQSNPTISLDESHARGELINALRKFKDAIPVVHMTFSTEVDQESLRELVSWVRASVHPHALLSVGLQPGLVAGVYVRTSNQVHDLSLRAALRKQRPVLIKELEALRGAN